MLLHDLHFLQDFFAFSSSWALYCYLGHCSGVIIVPSYLSIHPIIWSYKDLFFILTSTEPWIWGNFFLMFSHWWNILFSVQKAWANCQQSMTNALSSPNFWPPLKLLSLSGGDELLLNDYYLKINFHVKIFLLFHRLHGAQTKAIAYSIAFANSSCLAS